MDIKDSESLIFKELCNICLTPDSYRQDIRIKLNDNYKFITDNFVKMVLIFLRIRANIPLILLGETGCGKTSLIKALALFLKGQYRLIEFNIHSGLSYMDITKFLIQNKLVDKRENKESNIKEEKIILFLDEINTTNSINLLCDLFKSKKFLNAF